MYRELVVFLAVTSVALAALSIAPLEPKPEKFSNAEGCYIRELDEVIPLGGSASSSSSCLKYNCRLANVQIETCGVSVVQHPCKLVEDTTKLFPDCCPAIDCP
ncbi:U-megalopygitoxin(1)-Mo1-like [Epargyreus clarus]|uniref:U-megalopygitoxin(1)-Mo1-like n=1 Tax=Epargyreus clarus TaxID=520877 RepID=UPI003C2C212B